MKDKILNIFENKENGVLKIDFDNKIYIEIDLTNKKRIELIYIYSIVLREVTELDLNQFKEIINNNNLIFDNKHYSIIDYEYKEF